MPKDMLSEWEIFTLSPVFYLTVDFKEAGSDIFQTGSTFVKPGDASREKRSVTIAPKHNNSLKIFRTICIKEEPCNKHQSDFTCKYLVKSLKYQFELVPEEAKKSSESTKY